MANLLFVADVATADAPRFSEYLLEDDDDGTTDGDSETGDEGLDDERLDINKDDTTVMSSRRVAM
jgi:hypothetical protein